MAAVSAKHPSLENVYDTADGLKLYLERSGDLIIQNMFYDGWKSDCFISNVLFFSFL